MARLSGEALQRLRATCRAFRKHTVLLSAVQRVQAAPGTMPSTATDLAFLGQLRNLRRLSFSHLPSLHFLHKLSGLQNLHRLEVESCPTDVTPLCELQRLRCLVLREAEPPDNISCLSQLTKLCLYEADVGQELLLLTSLRSLKFWGSPDMCGLLAGLTGLAHVDMGLMPKDELDAALDSLERLPALASLAFNVGSLPLDRQLQLSTVTALEMSFDMLEGQQQPDLSLRAMLQLRRLTLDELEGSVAVDAPTVSRIRLRPLHGGIVHLPLLTACVCLSVLQLDVQPHSAATVVLVDPERLPAQALQVLAHISAHVRIFCPHMDMEHVHIQYVDRLGTLSKEA